ncbi:hypothetical protein M3638_17400 [Oceanobacillus profundus]|uniref:FIMAH domain-containing protein n=1 Tax=Oceanobacillus profundus TaxID=372463 RepID=UPI000BA5FCDF|nr:hypothetical protein [Oceanobacillus profundus]MCM3399593.1 hypothetical protein [Oceanobacillus profundus]PAE27631.1 hypothetical protein CHI07_18595 [Paenibacillus sp. 7884-2]
MSASLLIEEINRLAEAGEFANHGAARSLQAQLNPVVKFENQGNAKKVVQHVKKFNKKLHQQYDKDFISKEGYEKLYAYAAELLEIWK